MVTKTRGKCYWCGAGVDTGSNCCRECAQKPWKVPEFGPDSARAIEAAMGLKSVAVATHHPSRDASQPVAVTEASRLCPVDQQPIADPRARYCSPACRKQAWRASRG
jgi:hypothetical protein